MKSRLDLVRLVVELPWQVVRGMFLVVVTMVRFARPPRTNDNTVCPIGHANNLLGAWRCMCGFEFAGHGLRTPCPNCGAGAGWVACERCGLGVRP